MQSAGHDCGLDVRVYGPSTVTGCLHYDRGSIPSTCRGFTYHGVCTVLGSFKTTYPIGVVLTFPSGKAVET